MEELSQRWNRRVEFAISCLQVRCPNHYTTKPHMMIMMWFRSELPTNFGFKIPNVKYFSGSPFEPVKRSGHLYTAAYSDRGQQRFTL